MLMSKLTVNMLLYNVKRVCFVLYPWHYITLHYKKIVALIYSVTICEQETKDCAMLGSFQLLWCLWLVTVPVPNPAQQGLTWVTHQVLRGFARHNIFLVTITSSNPRLGSAFKLFQVYCQMWRYFLINCCCKTLPICFFKKQNKTKQND